MRVLHISHNGLPDPRVEKAALTLKRQGHTLLFLGGQPIRYQNLGAFDETGFLSAGNAAKVVFSRKLARAWRAAIRELRPDVIHAHNVIVARFGMHLGLPMIYDDHELWSKTSRLYRPEHMWQRWMREPFNQLVPRWEAHLARSCPCLATNDQAAEMLRRHGGWVGVVRNAPLRSMVAGLELDRTRRGTVYIGHDFDRESFAPHRDMTGLRDVLDFDVVCDLPHRNMLERLTQYRVGITPWRYHPVLRYKDQNRNYEYLHAGLQVVVSEQLKAHFTDDPYVHGYGSYREIGNLVAALPRVTPHTIAGHAHERYLWEHQEDRIHEAYERALDGVSG